MPQPAALWPSPHNVLQQRLTIFGGKYYQILIATYLPTPEGWKAEYVMLWKVLLSTTGFQCGHRVVEREYAAEHLEPGHAYRVRVCCFSAGGQSDVSNYYCVSSFMF